MKKYKVKRGDFMAMSTIATNLSEDETEKLDRKKIECVTLILWLKLSLMKSLLNSKNDYIHM